MANSTTEEKKIEVQSGMEILLHPLVVISMSDHFTRAKLTLPKDSKDVPHIIGILLGMIKNGKLEITNSFDIVANFDASTGKLVSVDESFLRRRKKAFKDVFEDVTAIGWYESGSSLSADDNLIMARALGLTDETMIAMSFDGMSAFYPETKDIPIQLFEATLKGKTPSEQTVALKKTSYHIITIEAERIGVDHIAKTSTAEGSSQLTVHVLGVQGAMKMLYSKIDIICDYLKKVEEKKAPYDQDIMRKIGVVHDLLLTAQAPTFNQRFFVEYNDEMLLAYLSSLTEGLQTMNTMVDTHVVNRKPPERRHPEKKKLYGYE